MRRQTLLRRLLIVGGVVLVLAFVIVGPMLLSRATRPTPTPALATVERRSFSAIASASGSLQNANLVNVNFSTAGTVLHVFVQASQTVTPGEALAKLNDQSQQADLNFARAQLNAAAQQLAQARASGSSAQIAAAQAQVASAQAGLITAEHHETATLLTAPEAGTVLSVNGQVGNVVSAGNTGPLVPGAGNVGAAGNGFIVIGSGSSYVLWAPFSQADDVRLQVGQSGVVSVDALPGQSFPSKVTLIETSATQVNGVPEYYAESTLTRTDPRLRNGQTATVSVVVASVNNVLAVPTQALFNNASGAFQVDVWYLGAPVATTVTVGLTGTTLTQITSGLQQGQQVMLSPVGETLPSTPAPTPT
jgi:membrane fusion protein, macrolide-specific efflux system